MPPLQKLVINDVDMATFGLYVDMPQGWGNSPAQQDRLVTSRYAGEFIDPLGVSMSGRQVALPCVLLSASAAAAVAALDAIKLHLANAWLDVMVAPWTDRVLVCRLREVAPQPRRATSKGYPVTLTVYAPNPYLLSPLVDVVGLPALVDTPMVLGTAPSPFVVRVVGAATNPTLTYRDVNGMQRGTFILLTSLAADEWVEFNSLTRTIVRHPVLGGVVNGAALFERSSQLFQLDPQDGVASRGPTLTLSSGEATVYVRKAYL